MEPTEESDCGSYAFGCIITGLVIIIVAVCFLSHRPLIGAPIPPPPKLTAEMMVGRWQYDWGGRKDGWIEFNAEGQYWSRHEPGEKPTHAGAYTVADGVLTLHEGRCPIEGDWDALFLNQDYPIAVTMQRWPAVAGVCRGTEVRFSNRIGK